MFKYIEDEHLVEGEISISMKMDSLQWRIVDIQLGADIVKWISSQVNCLKLRAVLQGSLIDVDDVIVARIQVLQVAALVESVVIDDTQAYITHIKEVQVGEFCEKDIGNAAELWISKINSLDIGIGECQVVSAWNWAYNSLNTIKDACITVQVVEVVTTNPIGWTWAWISWSISWASSGWSSCWICSACH